MNEKYKEHGFIHIPSLFKEEELQETRCILEDFHARWLKDNQALFENQVLNSSSITGSDYLDVDSRLCLFNFISNPAMMKLITSVIPTSPCFVNTQLFFNPKNISQKNYWHRDPQYHLSLSEQESSLQGPNILHIRIPMQDERGIEVVPGTHLRWDTQEELNVRLEKNGRKHHEDLRDGRPISLKTGDALLFSANMLHRGLYGMDRLALDILVCEPDGSLLEFAKKTDLPDEALMQKLAYPALFENTLRFA